MKFNIIVAVDINLGIGKNNSLPWKLPGDLKRFKEVTSAAPEGKRNAVIMGRKTWDSLPSKVRPLPDRLNVVLSRQSNFDLPNDCILASSLDDALSQCEKAGVANAYVIGGSDLFSLAIEHDSLNEVFLTEIYKDFDCDCFFPPYGDKLTLLPGSQMLSENNIDYSFKTLEPAKITQPG